MNTKIMATVLVSLMVVSCMGLVISDDTAADDIGAGTNVVNVGTLQMTQTDTEEVTLLINESAYNSGNYTIAWSAATLTNNTTAGTWGGSIVGNSAVFEGGDLSFGGDATGFPTVSIERDTAGQYTVTFTTSSTEVKSYQMVLRAQINVSVNGQTMGLTTIYYTVTVDVVSASTTGGDLATPTVPDFTYGVSSSHALDFTSATGGYVPPNVAALTWYAVGLPQGLAMSSDGVISGTPLVVTGQDGVDVTIYARNATGQNYVGTVKVIVNAASQSLPTSIASIQFSEGVVFASSNTYMVEQNTAVTMTVTLSSSGSAPTVTVIGSDSGTPGRHQLAASGEGTAYSYAIPTSGTGAYIIQIQHGGDTMEVLLYVFATPQSAVQAGIIVGGA